METINSGKTCRGCIVSITTLADATGLSENTVRAALGDLEAAGWVGVTRSRGGRSLDGVGYAHAFEFLDPNPSTSCTLYGEATLQNEPTNPSKMEGQPFKKAGLTLQLVAD
jgi:hypothetical protein